MSQALEPGAVIFGRYSVLEFLGRGGFSFAYIALDERSDLRVVIKELFPAESRRLSDGEVVLPGEPVSAQRLVHQFLAEARLLAKLHSPGVVSVRDAFQWAGTGYTVFDLIPGGRTLAEEIAEVGRIPPVRSVAILIQVCDALAAVHAEGILHRDIKPTNIVLGPGDRAYLIDFGAAREWHADATVRHTALFTPGYAPIEQLGEKGRRGPATDIYALAATAYEMLSGSCPPSSPDRVGGAPLPRVDLLEPTVSPAVATAIHAGLAIRAADRPQSALEFRGLLESGELSTADECADAPDDLVRLDSTLARLNRLKFSRSACPACGGLLEHPKPLRRGSCIVCRQGKISPRRLDESKCPICRAGFLKSIRNIPLSYCPLCSTGRLTALGLLKRSVSCERCSAKFTRAKGGLLSVDEIGARGVGLVELGQPESELEFWLPLSGRGESVVECDSCDAQFDDLEKGRRRLAFWTSDPFSVAKGARVRSVDEWTRIASRLPVDSGTHVCGSCSADFYVDEHSITVLDAERDPFGVFYNFGGRRLDAEEALFIAAGKHSGADGLLCRSCATEFDADGEYLRLRYSDQARMSQHSGLAYPVEDWHRIAAGLPTMEEEPDFLRRLHETLVASIVSGEIEWTPHRRERLLWSGRATRLREHEGELERDVESIIEVSEDALTFAHRSRGCRIPLDAIRTIRSDGNVLSMRAAGHQDTQHFEIETVGLTVDLESGKHSVQLTATEMCEILTAKCPALTGKPYTA